MCKRISLMMVVMGLLTATANAIPVADIYIPFENSSGTTGPGSEKNPGWANVGSVGIQNPYCIGSLNGTVNPTIRVNSANPLKDDYLDVRDIGASTAAMNGIH